MNIILAKDQDTLNQCLKIREDVFTIEKGVSKDIEVDEYDAIDTVCDHLLIQEQQNIGALRIFHKDDETIKVQRFCFYKEFRNKGYGKQVMHDIEEIYKTIGIQKIVMDAKFEVYSFYEKCGYKVISEPFIEANIKHVKMEKSI